jgi:hypothetical protein
MNPAFPTLYRNGGGTWVWYPKSLDVDALLEAYGRRIGEGVLWLGHCVIVGLAGDARCHESGRVPLRAEYLRSVIGQHQLDDVRQAARAFGYVDRNPSYRAGHRSQSYWILPPLDRARPIRRPITDARLRHNIERWREQCHRETWQQIERGETPVSAAVCRHLWQSLQRVAIDAVIDFRAPLDLSYQLAVERIRQGELRIKVDDYGRIHTNLTNLSKSLRQHLTVGGRRLMNIDISESQPLFIGLALASAEKAEKARRMQRHDERTTKETGKAEGMAEGKQQQGMMERKACGANQPRPLMMCNTMMCSDPLVEEMLDRCRLPSDLRRYLELCEGRGLYQAVADRLGRTRDDAKHGVMVAFFDRPSHHNAVSKVLAELFPSVMEAVARVKRGDYRRLAHFAQRIESAFMFGRVIPRIMALRPELFVSTIHDSILTTAGDEKFVQQVMLDEFANLGLFPQVKIESCSKMLCEGQAMC